MDFQRNIIRGLAAAAALAAATTSGTAQAATASTNLSVTATVTDNCAVSTTAVAFGAVDTMSATPDDATGTVSVTCTNGTAWTAGAGTGAGAGATLAVRRMSAGGNTLSYGLYTDAARIAVWGDGTGGTATVPGTGTGAAQTFNVYGRVPTGQSSVPVGAYSDTVVVTVTYP